MAIVRLPDEADTTDLLYWRKQIDAQTIAFVDITQGNCVLLCDASKVLDA
jgi:hypothetical protein